MVVLDFKLPKGWIAHLAPFALVDTRPLWPFDDFVAFVRDCRVAWLVITRYPENRTGQKADSGSEFLVMSQNAVSEFGVSIDGMRALIVKGKVCGNENCNAP